MMSPVVALGGVVIIVVAMDMTEWEVQVADTGIRLIYKYIHTIIFSAY